MKRRQFLKLGVIGGSVLQDVLSACASEGVPRVPAQQSRLHPDFSGTKTSQPLHPIVSFETLLNEMIDYTAVARWPQPAYTCRQFSSYDRASVAPDKPGWFSNNDFSNFLRSEEHQGRKEWVMMDAKGPGCVSLFWHGGPPAKGLFRIYLDDSEIPAIAGTDVELLCGQGAFKPPFSKCVIPSVPAAGKNLYLPIPYAQRCVVTYDGPNYWETKDGLDMVYWHLDYRTYEPGTQVETFSMDKFNAAQSTVDRVGRTLVNPPAAVGDRKVSKEKLIKPDGRISLKLGRGPASIRTLEIKIQADELEPALRSTVLQISFDGEETVWCPVGDFSGSGVGLNPFQDWYRTVTKDGTMTCRWVMPYEKSAKITLTNLGKQEVKASVKAIVGSWTWDERSMHFHSTWHYQWPFLNYPPLDWNFIEAHGKGVMVGDTLALMTNHTLWWGEGDEKIYVDGESFPSHFGTGSEDYYGYAYGVPVLFSEPFHAQPRVGLYAHMGHRTNTRSRSLDAIPFHKSLKFDIEAWGGVPNVQVAYAGTTYWYARPGATCNYPPSPEQAREPIPSPYPGVPGALEAERMIVLKKTGGETGVQKQPGVGFSADSFWWTEGKVGDKVEFLFESPFEPSEYDLYVNLAKSAQGATIQIYLDGKKVGELINLYGARPTPTGEVLLGRCNGSASKGGGHRLEIEFTGADEKAQRPYRLGLDYIRLEKLKEER